MVEACYLGKEQRIKTCESCFANIGCGKYKKGQDNEMS